MRSIRPIPFVLAMVLACASSADASRVKDYSLSECIQKADIILTATVVSSIDQREHGILKVRVLYEFKGTVEKKEITIVARGFHSERNGNVKPGPIKVKPGDAYIFFLKENPNENNQYSMFDRCDGIIQPNGPVNLEIRNQLRKADTAK